MQDCTALLHRTRGVRALVIAGLSQSFVILAGAVDLVDGIGVDQNFDVGEFDRQLGFHLVHDAVCLGNRQVGIDADMELDEILRTAGARAQIVDVDQFGMARRDVEEAGAFFGRPFLVHQLVERLARCAPGAIKQPQCDQHAEHGVCARHAQILLDHERRDHRTVEQQIALIMDIVGADRHRSRPRDHTALIADKPQRQQDRDHRDANAIFSIGGGIARHQP